MTPQLRLAQQTLAHRSRKEPSIRSNQTFVFDLNGTLVDSVYQHVLAWQEALDHAGIAVSVWRIHRRIGMSGGREPTGCTRIPPICSAIWTR
jgi:hypothetical protein